MSFRTSEGSTATGIWKKKWKDFTTDISADSTSQSETSVSSPVMLSGGWVLRLRLWRLDHRERTGVECHDESLKGLVQHSRGTPGRSLCQPER